jgi:Flp pilus assembly protein TadG
MKPKSQERGQALVIIALAVVGLFGFSALAIDGSRVFSDRRNAQNAADTAALSAALAKIRQTDYVDAAEKRAESNSYATDANSTVEVNLCSELVAPDKCLGIPTTGTVDQQAPANYVRVKITSTIPATFARIVGRQEFTNIVTAVAYSGPVEPKPVVNGAALAALKEEGKGTLNGTGTVNLKVIGSGVFNNSTDPCATTIAGAGGQYTVTTSFQHVGWWCPNGGTATLNPVTKASPIPYPPKFNIQEPTIVCSGSGSIDPATPQNNNVTTVSPGNFGAENINAAGPVIFEPGNYCFGGNFKINGSANVTADYVNFKLTDGEFSLNGVSTLTCNDMLVHIDEQGTGVRFNGSSRVDCNNVTFFASTGDVTWAGTATVRMFAPLGGEYKGLLIYMPYGNDSDLTISGTTGNELTGSILAVSSNIKIVGVSDTTGLHSQIVGYTVEIKGSANLELHYDPDKQYWEVDPTAVTLTK